MSTTITIHADDLTPFQVAPRDQGQIIEVAYASHPDGYVRRTTDRSDGTVTYEYAGDDGETVYEPQNGRVPGDDLGWRPARLA